MQKKPLKVEPARRVYKPKYPSYADKNPLLYPETRPYPFSHKFIKWASTGGLASIMLFSGSELLGQTQTDSLYNPFPLENARVPYQPVSFGTGMPERIRSEDAIKAIRKAFSESGVQLDENVWMDDGSVSLYLDGYSKEDEIGFVFMNYTNMDETFVNGRSYDRKKKTLRKIKLNLKKDLELHKTNVNGYFQRFVKNKDKYVKGVTRFNITKAAANFSNQLAELEPKNESEAIFNTYHLQYTIEHAREDLVNKPEPVQDMIQYIDNRFDDGLEKVVLIRKAGSFKRENFHTDAFYSTVIEKFNDIKGAGSDKDFIKKYMTLYELFHYESGKYFLKRDEHYLAIKVEIMKDYPIEKWFEKANKLDAYKEQKFMSLNEVKKLDKRNKKGKQFIAPISSRDQAMIIRRFGPYAPLEDLLKEQALLRKEYNHKNGMTDKVRSQRKAEYQEVGSRYKWKDMKDLPKQERDSLQKLQTEERAVIKRKYEAMEKLTKEEKAVYELRFADLFKKIEEQRDAAAKDAKIKTLQNLEKQVKTYIKWARSQMGG